MDYLIAVFSRCLAILTDYHHPVFWLWWASVLITSAKDARRPLVHRPLKQRIRRLRR